MVLSSPDNLKSAVSVAAQVLGDKSAEGWLNAPALASEWSAWYDGSLTQVEQRVDHFNYNDLDAILLQADARAGYTYYKLQDLGQALGFNVTWAADTGITADTATPYQGA